MLLLLIQESLIGMLIVSVFFWSTSLSSAVLLIAIILGVVVYRPELEKKIISRDNLLEMTKGILKRPLAMVLIATIIAMRNQGVYPILAIISTISLVISLASVSFLIFKERRTIRENILAISITGASLISGWLFADFFASSFFSSKFFPSLWIFGISEGDLAGFLMVSVLSIWLFRMRHRLDKSR
ncbi:MAG: multidrug transporter [Kosmotogaceae bacterium]|nr:multidrug transporter [Kosmotogaceae bacterium]